MKGKDEIKELFQKELGNYEAKVDPSLWNGIQSGLTGASTAGGVTTGMSIISKVIIGVVIATAATVASIVIFSNEEPTKKSQTIVQKTETLKEIKDNTSEDLVLKETFENVNEPKTEIKETPNSEEKEKVNIESQPVVVPEVMETVDIVVTEAENKSIIKPAELSPIENNKENESREETEYEKPLIAHISIDKQDNQYVKFNVKGENIKKMEWYFGDGKSSKSNSPEHFYEESGNFEVVAIVYGEEGETIEKTIQVKVEVKGKLTKLPNTFTPNNDGVNDEFFVEHEEIVELQLNIFNQRQELLFSTNDLNFRWKGYDSKGERVPDGDYIYVIIAKDKAGNVINKYKTLTITR